MQHDPFRAARTHSVRYLELLSRAVGYIDEHLGDPLDGDVLADLAAMSRYHFQRIFRAYFGTTVAGYVTWRRMQRACELLAQNPTSVREVALEVGYESAQALAKAMRRELDTTPVAVRAGEAPRWQRLFDRRPSATSTDQLDRLLKPQMIDLPALPILTATARGMNHGDLTPAARRAFGELLPAIEQASLKPRALGWLALFPDEPQGLDDQQARMVCGAVFDYSLTERAGRPAEPALALEGSLTWARLPAGRYAVFVHMGAHALLHAVWRSIYRDWLPATGYALREMPCFEHYVNDPRAALGDQSRTDLYLPLT